MTEPADSPVPSRRRLAGVGLHSGRACAVTLARISGPVRFATDLGARRPDELTIRRADQGVQVAAPDIELDVDLVEHLFAALGGLSIRRDLCIRVEGGEVPLLDGGAAELVSALDTLDLSPSDPVLEVARRERFVVSESCYELCPSHSIEIEVSIDFTARGLGVENARWDGTAEDFRRRIAPARTFGFFADAESLRRRGRAKSVDLRSVLVLDARGEHTGTGRPRRSAELARHKLLDLIGDLYLFGGPPRGRVLAHRPGHAASHEVFRRALREGALRPVSAPRIPRKARAQNSR